MKLLRACRDLQEEVLLIKRALFLAAAYLYTTHSHLAGAQTLEQPQRKHRNHFKSILRTNKRYIFLPYGFLWHYDFL